MKNTKQNKLQNPFVNRVIVYLPSTINLDNLLFDYPTSSISYHMKNPQRRKDNVAFILGQIYSSRSVATGSKFPNNNFTPLCSEYLKDAISNYNQYIEYLKESGVIESNESYKAVSEGRGDETYCLKYRFKDEYFPNGTNWLKYVIYDSKIVRDYFERKIIDFTQYQGLEKFELLKAPFKSLTIDQQKAKLILKEQYPNDDAEANMQMDSVRRLLNEDLHTFSIGKTGRIYNPISNIKKELRPLLEVGGESLIEIDIKSSIPFMSLILFDSEKIQNNDKLREIIQSANRLLDFEEISEMHYTVPGMSSSLEYQIWQEGSFLFMGDAVQDVGDNSMPKDIKKYIELVQSGDIYQYMANKWNLDCSVNIVYNRPNAKKKLLSMLNQPSNFKTQERELFIQEFPNVNEVFSRLNTGYTKVKNGKGKSKKGKNDIDCPFAYFTQRLEAFIVLEQVAIYLLEQNPGMPLFTIHDALYTTKSNVAKVVNRINKVVLDLTGRKIEVVTKEL